jgi:anti-sigma B factor antagonist
MAGEETRTLQDELRFEISEVVVEGTTSIVSIAGAIDLSTANHFESALSDAVETSGTQGIVVDLSEVTFLDSTALTALVHCFERQRARLERLGLVASDARVRTLLEVTRLDRVLRVFPTRDEAVAYVADAHA